MVNCFSFTCWNAYFIVFFEHQPKFAPPPQKKKTITFHFAKHMSSKNNLLLQSPLDLKFVFSTCLVWNLRTFMLNKKHNIKSGKKTKIRKGIGKRKQDRKPKKERIDEKKPCNIIFWCCSFHEAQAKKKEKERKRQKQGTKRNQIIKKRRKEEKITKEREREREREHKKVKKGGGKKAKEKQRETLKLNKDALFQWENSFLY